MSRNFLSPALTAAALVAAFVAAPARAATYVQAPGSTLVFASSYDGETFTGKFGKFDTKVSFDPAHPELGTIDVTIGLAGTSSGNGDRDSTLASADFFDVGKFAQATYKAKGFKSLGGDRYSTDGVLTLRGVSKPVTLTFVWTPGAQPTLAGKATVKRLDFGVGGGDWKDTKTIPDAVAISTKVVLKPGS
ncbi:YceI family protein [Pseudoxanthomonas winnipegensis]|uniref:YceI family protein n=1 Tax=Pseudoxanthomonas winnipegensis TaxID=2480810 RepID=UPI001039C892|nr:YceI family protein [Pseudoxanthomonas winnipegensis]TBV72719.1 polyisoprenoid-binding protein [Pseudoxanthomonas winnipegensis]